MQIDEIRDVDWATTVRSGARGARLVIPLNLISTVLRQGLRCESQGGGGFCSMCAGIVGARAAAGRTGRADHRRALEPARHGQRRQRARRDQERRRPTASTVTLNGQDVTGDVPPTRGATNRSSASSRDFASAPTPSRRAAAHAIGAASTHESSDHRAHRLGSST